MNIRWKAPEEIYKIYILLHLSVLKISAKMRTAFFAISKVSFFEIIVFQEALSCTFMLNFD